MERIRPRACPEDRVHGKAASGVALIFVLWLMVLLSAVALEMAFRGHLRVQVTATTGESAKAFYVARAGLELAMSDLAESAKTGFAQDTDRSDESEKYQNVQVGEGSVTLYAGTDDSGDPRYGLADESAKINVATADATVLQRVPGLDVELAGKITAYREQDAFNDLKDLLAVKGMDMLMLYGEDQNQNGLLDANEDDGDETWPPDDADGSLNAGLSAYLTVWSACKNVSSDGQERVNINEADAEAITKAIPDIDSQQADSIVAQREKGEISSVLDLLDVEQVERVEGNAGQQGNEGQPPPNQQNQEAAQNQNQGKEQAGGGQSSSNGDSKGDEGKESKKEEGKDDKNGGDAKEDKGEKGDKDDQAKEENGEKKPEQKITYKGTGKKAFEQETVRKIADRLTTSKEDLLPGLINVNTAPVEVLACLPGLDESLAQAIVVARDGRTDGFKTVVDLLDVSGMTVDILKPIYGLLTARSDVYEARSIGVLHGGAVRASVSAVLDRTEDDVRIRYWQEND